MNSEGMICGSSSQLEGCVKCVSGVVDDPPPMDDEFMQNSYKVESCMLSHPHGWKVCPYVHPGEPVKRRHPSTHRGDMCPAVKKGLVCQIGPEQCPYAHNSFELWLHPSRYKTKMCRQGADCPRGICFFAHSESELRQRPVHNNNAAAGAASSSITASPTVIPTAIATTAAGLGASAAIPTAVLHVPAAAPAAATSAAHWMSSRSVPSVPAMAPSHLAGISPVAGVSPAAAALAPAAALTPVAPDHQLLLLQQQLNELKLQHEMEMQRMQEKMLLLQLLQQEKVPQGAVHPAPAVPSPSALVPVSPLTSAVTAAVDPTAAVRASAASTTAALLSNSSTTGSTSPGAQMLYVINNSGSAITGFSSAAGAFLAAAQPAASRGVGTPAHARVATVGALSTAAAQLLTAHLGRLGVLM